MNSSLKKKMYMNSIGGCTFNITPYISVGVHFWSSRSFLDTQFQVFNTRGPHLVNFLVSSERRVTVTKIDYIIFQIKVSITFYKKHAFFFFLVNKKHAFVVKHFNSPIRLLIAKFLVWNCRKYKIIYIHVYSCMHILYFTHT